MKTGNRSPLDALRIRLGLASDDEGSTPWTALFLWVTGLLLLARFVILAVAQHELGPDETQYWSWSKDLDFGYFSKPPLIAWAIALTTNVFGDAEWAVRLAAPIAHSVTAGFLFLAARDLHSVRAGFLAGLTWLLLPGTIVSSSIMSTDALVLACWSAGLWAFLRLSDVTSAPPLGRNAALGAGAGMGAALGFGFLGKYAVIYFPIGVGLAAILVPDLRRKLATPPFLLALIVAAAVATPNVIWNGNNDFQTLSHTAANANWGADMFHPGELVEFFGSQWGVAGPLTFSLMLAAVFQFAQGRATKASRVLLGFFLPALAIVCVQAFLSRAHANWAAVSYPAGVLLAIGVAESAAFKPWPMRAIVASIGVHAVVMAVYVAAVVSPQTADAIGLGGAFKRLRGWEAHAADIAPRLADVDSIMASDREILGGFIYYARNDEDRFIAWNSNHRIDNHYEAFRQFDADIDRAVLFVTTADNPSEIADHFAVVTPVGQSRVDLGDGRERVLFLFKAEGGRIPTPPPHLAK